jgi:hypothetical protein
VIRYKPPSVHQGRWGAENDLFGLKHAVGWAVDSMINKGKGSYQRVRDHDDLNDDDLNDNDDGFDEDDMENGGGRSVGWSSSGGASTTSSSKIPSSASGYGATIAVDDSANPFIVEG